MGAHWCFSPEACGHIGRSSAPLGGREISLESFATSPLNPCLSVALAITWSRSKQNVLCVTLIPHAEVRLDHLLPRAREPRRQPVHLRSPRRWAGPRPQPHGGGHRLRRGARRSPELRGRRLRRLPVHLCRANAVIANAAWCDSTGVNNEVRLYTKAYTRCVDAPEYYARTRMRPRVPSGIPGEGGLESPGENSRHGTVGDLRRGRWLL